MRKAALQKLGRFTKQDIIELCPSLSVSSIEGALRKLIAEGEVKREGVKVKIVECPRCGGNVQIVRTEQTAVNGDVNRNLSANLSTNANSNKNEFAVTFCGRCGYKLTNEYIAIADNPREAWIYRELHCLYGLERGQGLLEKMAQTLEDFESRKILFEKRFSIKLADIPQIKNKNTVMADKGLYLLNILINCSKQSNFSSKKVAGKNLESLVVFLQKNKVTMSSFKDEVVNLVYLYISLCKSSKKYTSVLFGLGKRKPQSVLNNIWDDLLALKEYYLEPNYDIAYMKCAGEAIVAALNTNEIEEPI